MGTCKRVRTCTVLRPRQQGRPQKDPGGGCSSSRGEFGSLSLWVLLGKVAAAPPHLKHGKLQGQGHRQSSGPRKLKPQDTSVTEDKDELSALHIGRTEPTNAEKASLSPSYRWDTAGRMVTGGGVYGIICPCGMPPPSSGSLRATTTCNSSYTRQVLQLEEPVPELEGLASTPDRHRSHPSKYNSALEGPLEEKASAHLGQVRSVTGRLLPPVHTKARASQRPGNGLWVIRSLHAHCVFPPPPLARRGCLVPGSSSLDCPHQFWGTEPMPAPQARHCLPLPRAEGPLAQRLTAVTWGGGL